MILDQSSSDASNTVLTNYLTETGLTDAIVGHWAWFLVILYDSSNNELDKGGDTVDAVLKNSLGVPTGVIDVKDLNDGTYLVEYLVESSNGIYTCEITVN